MSDDTAEKLVTADNWSLDEVMRRDPTTLTDEDLRDIIQYNRRRRAEIVLKGKK